MTTDWQDSIVLIRSQCNDNPEFGTGFVVHKDETSTYILTCAHVVNNLDGVQVNDYPATVIFSGEKQDIDLAVLQVQEKINAPSFVLHNSDEKGRTFIVKGYWQFYDSNIARQTLRGTLGEKIELYGHTEYAALTKLWNLGIDDDYPLQNGYSGSPVIDEVSGHVLGVVSHKIIIENREDKKGYAVAIEDLTQVWSEMPCNLLDNIPLQPPSPPSWLDEIQVKVMGFFEKLVMPDMALEKERYQDYRRQYPNSGKDEFVQKIIERESLWCSLVGIGASVLMETLILFPVGFIFDLIMSTRLQARMIYHIALTYDGYFGQPLDLKIKTYTILAAIPVFKVFVPITTPTYMMKSLFVEGSLRIVRRFGWRIFVKTLLRSLFRIIPLVGVILGGMINYSTTKATGKLAVKLYRDGASSD